MPSLPTPEPPSTARLQSHLQSLGLTLTTPPNSHRKLTTTQHIPRGTKVLTNRSIATTVLTATRCHHCLRLDDDGGGRSLRRCSGCRRAWYCSARCQTKDWREGAHKVVCGGGLGDARVGVAVRMEMAMGRVGGEVERDAVLAAVTLEEGLDEESRVEMMKIARAGGGWFGEGDGRQRERSLFLHQCRWMANGFNMTRSTDFRVYGEGYFPLASLVNHSCEPNVVTLYDGDVQTLIALRDVEAGEEILTSYIDPFHPPEERRERLRRYGFECHCGRCDGVSGVDRMVHSPIVEGLSDFDVVLRMVLEMLRIWEGGGAPSAEMQRRVLGVWEPFKARLVKLLVDPVFKDQPLTHLWLNNKSSNSSNNNNENEGMAQKNHDAFTRDMTSHPATAGTSDPTNPTTNPSVRTLLDLYKLSTPILDLFQAISTSTTTTSSSSSSAVLPPWVWTKIASPLAAMVVATRMVVYGEGHPIVAMGFSELAVCLVNGRADEEDEEEEDEAVWDAVECCERGWRIVCEGGFGGSDVMSLVDEIRQGVMAAVRE
ncbi:hypothetical protein HDU67_001396 [Dinochytrium kinnereticum]|nr:hypothetical protein HDU67_001396 [Dinochytrium kinnereticum]